MDWNDTFVNRGRYIKTANASVPSPQVQLADFRRVHIKAGAKVTVKLQAAPKSHSVVMENVAGNSDYLTALPIETLKCSDAWQNRLRREVLGADDHGRGRGVLCACWRRAAGLDGGGAGCGGGGGGQRGNAR